MAKEPAEKGKRTVKNPETFRERAIKASAASEQPAKRGIVKRAAGPTLTTVGKPIGRAGRKLGSYRVMRIIGKIVFPAYFRKSWQELKLVKWPSWRESRRLTYAVLIFAIIFGAAIATVDYGLGKLFKHILLK